MHKRRGISLVELLVTMSACCIILTMSATLIHRMLHVQSRSRAFQNAERSALRLERSLRRDAHQTREVIPNKEPQQAELLLQFELPKQQRVEYRQADGQVSRLLLEGDRVIAREDFAFPATTTFRVERSPGGAVTLLSSDGSPDALTPSSVRAPLRIELTWPRSGGAS